MGVNHDACILNLFIHQSIHPPSLCLYNLPKFSFDTVFQQRAMLIQTQT